MAVFVKDLSLLSALLKKMKLSSFCCNEKRIYPHFDTENSELYRHFDIKNGKLYRHFETKHMLRCRLSNL